MKVYRSVGDFMDDVYKTVELADFLEGTTKRRKRRKRRVVRSIMRCTNERCVICPETAEPAVCPQALEPWKPTANTSSPG